MICGVFYSSRFGWSLEETLQQCVMCHDTVSLFQFGLRMMLDSLRTDEERHIMKQVTHPPPKKLLSVKKSFSSILSLVCLVLGLYASVEQINKCN